MADADSGHRATFSGRAAELGIELPNVPVPIANFRPFRVCGSMAFMAGQTCEWNGEMTLKGKIGLDHDIPAGQQAARICGLNLIAALSQACDDDLGRVEACIRLGGFVNAPADFEFVPKVINGASDLMHEFFGDIGAHARTAVGVETLPQRAAVEVDAIFMLRLS
ncbi:MAG: RidA family protein [Minwuia sp.]|uniref:RidA family protein n=1 Tax=Minwuia sp. TaxID=2493630 RepID=UPI003A85DD5A